MEYEKLLNEIYAAISLKYLWQEYKPYFVKAESPDWINPTMELGLEVSQALYPADGKEGYFVEQFLGKKQEELPKEAIEYYGSRLHFYNGRFWAILPSEETSCVMRAKFRFDRKLEKLNSNYKQSKYNGLYLFLHPANKEQIDIDDLFQYIRERQEKVPRRYDYVFLNSVDRIIIFNYIEDSVSEIIYPENADTFLEDEAAYLRYMKDWTIGTRC